MKKCIAIITALMGLSVASFGLNVPLDTTLTYNIDITSVEASYQPSTPDQDFVMAQAYYNTEVATAGHPDVQHSNVRVDVMAHQIKVTKEEICQLVKGQSYTQELYESCTLAELTDAIIGIARTKFLAAMAQQ